MQVGLLWPGDWDHGSVCVEFHCARTQRDHAVQHGVVFFAESEEVPVEVQFILAVIMESMVLQVISLSLQSLRDAVSHVGFITAFEDVANLFDICRSGSFIQ